MNQWGNAILNVYSIAIILVIFFHASRFFRKENLSDRLFILLLKSTVLMLISDTLSRFDGKASVVYPVLNHVGNFVVYLMSPVLPSLWVAYVHIQVFHDENRVRRLFYPLLAINVLNAVTLIVFQFFGWIYNIDSENIYHRGPLFWFPASFAIVLIIWALFIIFRNHKRLGRKGLLSLCMFSVLPAVGTFLQIALYGYSLIMSFVVLSLLIVFLNILNNSLNTDYLTGVSNRKKLDAYLKEKVRMSNEKKSFSAILIDIDNFKRINDTFGHDMGDDALETAAKLIKSCLRANDFIARYGGDEFCIVLDISSQDDLEALVRRIRKRLEEYNRSGSNIFELDFSMGYAVYDHRTHTSVREFLKEIDMLMYQDKYSSKRNDGSDPVDFHCSGQQAADKNKEG